MSSDRKNVLVTGANGYLALHVIKEVLSKGYDVRGTVRSQKAGDKVRATFPADYGNRLTTTFVEDLTKPDNFRDAFDTNTVGVIHVASPVHGHVEDNVRDMLDPAIKGAVGIMEASRLYSGPSFKRVVHTSSFAAMLDVSKDPRIGYIYDESDWNPTTFEEASTIQDHVALYVASKPLSEKAVWDWVKDKEPNFDIACLNPATVFGPHLEPPTSLDEVTSTSKLLWNLVDAIDIPKLLWAGAIDVRDTAAMLVAALEKSTAGGQRFLLAHHFDWQTASDDARELLPEEVAKRIQVGKPGTGKAEALESLYQVNGRKAVDVLGIEYRPISETVKDTLEQFLEIERRNIT